MIRMYFDSEYRVIHSNEIASMKNPGFPWKGNSEENFVDFMEQSQKYFREWELSKSNSSYKVGDIDMACVYLYLGNCVCVERNEKGEYIISANGRHRLYIAKKYRFDILVCVMNS